MPEQNDIEKPLLYEVEVSSRFPSWDDFLVQHPNETIYHHPFWGTIMQQAYGNHPYYLTARCAGQITGILQLVAQKSILFGHHLCSLPYFDASGILAQDNQSSDMIVAKSRDLLKELSVDWVELRHLNPMDASIPVRSDKITLQLPLPEDEETLWKQFTTKVRNKIRKTQQNNVEVKQGGIELVDDFYKVYTQNMRDLGSPPHSGRFFRLIVEYFPKNTKLFAVYLDGRAIAASLTLTDRNAFRVPWSGTVQQGKSLNTNMILYWSMLAEACRASTKSFDFGRSSRDSGTHMFKKQWGAVDIPLYWHFLLPPGKDLPDLNPDSPKYHLMVACWKKLPLPITRLLGPRLISKLS
jgi:FemAB-related protein (PEP-CTERM system-associated)